MKFLKFVVLSLLSFQVYAWEPTKPITVIIGSGAGSAIETNFRTVSDIISRDNPKVNFVISNKPGADSVLALNSLLNEKPDGHTIAAVAHMSIFVTHDIWQSDIKKYNHDTFITPLMIAKSPLVIVARNNSSVNTPKELVQRLKTTKEPINVAIGGGAHKITFEYLMMQIKGDRKLIQSIRYPGPLQAVTAVAAGDTEFGIMPITTANPLVQSGRVKVIALTSEFNLDGLNAPLMKDFVPGLNAYAGTLIALPPNTPKEIVDWYRKTFSEVIRSEEAKVKYKNNYIFYVEDELTESGMKRWIQSLRKQWLPMKEFVNVNEK